MPIALKKDPKKVNIHLVSDSTGTTLHGLARACLVQFEGLEPVEKFWNMIRSDKQLEIVMRGIEAMPGPVIYTLVDKSLRRKLKDFCRQNKIPCIAVLDPVIKGLSMYLGQEARGMPGLQHQLDNRYFERIDAVEFALHHDDGQLLDGLEEADVILVGVSRTSKTPTCMYLANRGVKAANIPLVPSVPFPEEVIRFKRPLFIGLTESPKRLAQLRNARVTSDDASHNERMRDNRYILEDEITDEIRKARRLFTKMGWPSIDVTKRSIEETAAQILTLLTQHRPDLDL